MGPSTVANGFIICLVYSSRTSTKKALTLSSCLPSCKRTKVAPPDRYCTEGRLVEIVLSRNRKSRAYLEWHMLKPQMLVYWKNWFRQGNLNCNVEDRKTALGVNVKIHIVGNIHLSPVCPHFRVNHIQRRVNYKLRQIWCAILRGKY